MQKLFMIFPITITPQGDGNPASPSVLKSGKLAISDNHYPARVRKLVIAFHDVLVENWISDNHYPARGRKRKFDQTITPQKEAALKMISRKNFSQSQQVEIGKTRIIQGATGFLMLMSLLSLLLAPPSLASPEPPNSVIAATRQDLSRKTKISVNRLQIQAAQPQTWPDGCLGLAKPGEFCTQALVQGWRIILTDNQKTWVYRTNSSGANLRLEK